mmetsp:Transcript_38456/g.86697  ORF Transcript_38456/g.86697 Transcript_38456/m.86697 type:complete len:122 (-) Transcript_38456:31-396(-)
MNLDQELKAEHKMILTIPLLQPWVSRLRAGWPSPSSTAAGCCCYGAGPGDAGPERQPGCWLGGCRGGHHTAQLPGWAAIWRFMPVLLPEAPQGAQSPVFELYVSSAVNRRPARVMHAVTAG